MIDTPIRETDDSIFVDRSGDGFKRASLVTLDTQSEYPVAALGIQITRHDGIHRLPSHSSPPSFHLMCVIRDDTIGPDDEEMQSLGRSKSGLCSAYNDRNTPQEYEFLGRKLGNRKTFPTVAFHFDTPQELAETITHLCEDGQISEQLKAVLLGNYSLLATESRALPTGVGGGIGCM